MISAIFLGKKAIKWGLITIVPVLVASGTTTLSRSYKHGKAVEIISQLESYRKTHGIYPNELSEVTQISLNGLKYAPYKDQKNYEIEYLMDGFNREYYNSSRNIWGTFGWND